MTIDRIIKKFKSKSYRIVWDWSGKVVVRDPRGFGKSFDSYAAAHKHYFGY